MDKRQRELEALVTTQKEQLSRYEKRLKGNFVINYVHMYIQHY